MNAHVCRKCGKELVIGEDTTQRLIDHSEYICTECSSKRMRLWRKANPEKTKASWTRCLRKQGMRPFNENKECTLYLGVYIAERVLSRAFKDVVRTPLNNRGYDFICSMGMLVDSKCSCQGKDMRWGFHIMRNTVADYFLCLAFDNRKDLNPLYAWMIPGGKINHQTLASICPSTIHKWDEYRLDLTKISNCCDAIKGKVVL